MSEEESSIQEHFMTQTNYICREQNEHVRERTGTGVPNKRGSLVRIISR